MTQEIPPAGQNRLGRFSYAIGWCSFIPLFVILFLVIVGHFSSTPQIGQRPNYFLSNLTACAPVTIMLGVLLGLITIVQGILKRKESGWKLVTLGAVGMFINILIIGAFFFLASQALQANHASKEIAKQGRRHFAQCIEFYKTTHGHYPESLADLEKAAAQQVRNRDAFDSSPSPMPPPLLLQSAYYQLEPNHQHYYLLWAGPDGKAFTTDDTTPEFSDAELKNMGLKIH